MSETKITYIPTTESRIIIVMFEDYFSLPVSEIIWNFARKPICGDGDKISFVNGCEKKDTKFIPTTIRIGTHTINKWYCEDCANKFIITCKNKVY